MLPKTHSPNSNAIASHSSIYSLGRGGCKEEWTSIFNPARGTSQGLVDDAKARNCFASSGRRARHRGDQSLPVAMAALMESPSSGRQRVRPQHKRPSLSTRCRWPLRPELSCQETCESSYSQSSFSSSSETASPPDESDSAELDVACSEGGLVTSPMDVWSGRETAWLSAADPTEVEQLATESLG